MSCHSPSQLGGAHASHLMDCDNCHLVPTLPSDLGHMDDGPPAEVSFGDLASSNSAEPVWNGETCSGVYCHGATLSGGFNKVPVWSKADGSQVGCATCHGLPPPRPHPPGTDCFLCHGSVVNAGLGFVDRSLHINGIVNVDSVEECSACHGGAENPAPPVSVMGETDVAETGIGAHQRHVGNPTISTGALCIECHVVPTRLDDSGHMDSALPAEVTFTGRAVLEGHSAIWNGETCADTYCHNPDPSDTYPNRASIPIWTIVDGSQVGCDSCHGYPPWTDSHPSRSTFCGNCHSEVVGPDHMTIVDVTKHVNGSIEVDADQACNSCHGGENNAAPPISVAGGTDTSLRGVGAHQAHLAPGVTVAVACSDCHIVPVTAGAAGHLDSALPAEVTFAGRAVLHSSSPAWNGTTCSGTYCHNPDSNDVAPTRVSAPDWTTVNGSQAACGACHGYPPQNGGCEHDPLDQTCGQCHMDVVGPDNLTIINKSLHMNGSVQTGCYDATCHCWGG